MIRISLESVVAAAVDVAVGVVSADSSRQNISCVIALYLGVVVVLYSNMKVEHSG